jgi:hypothetical protein
MSFEESLTIKRAFAIALSPYKHNHFHDAAPAA